jgi:hypothetical protein
MGLPLPGEEGLEGLLAHHLNHGNFALRRGLRNLTINERVVEAGSRRIGRSAAEVDTRRARPTSQKRESVIGYVCVRDVIRPIQRPRSAAH